MPIEPRYCLSAGHVAVGKTFYVRVFASNQKIEGFYDMGRTEKTHIRKFCYAFTIFGLLFTRPTKPT